MSDNFFKIKKGLNIDPTDASSVSNPELGDLIIDSSDNNKLKKHNGTAFVNAVTKEDLSLQNVDNTSDADKPISTATQTALNTKVNSSGGTLTNGSIVAPSRLDAKQDEYANLLAYAATASDGQIVFATDTKELFKIANNGLEPIGGGGVGGINYIENYDFENNVDNWVSYADADSESPIDGEGGSPTTTITRTTTTPLRGAGSGLIFKLLDGGSARGEGVKYDFTIDAADQAQVLRISFDYSTSTNYADGDIRLYVYDVTNSRLIEVVDRDLYASSFGKFVGTFQTSPDSTSYRLIFHVASTNALAYTVTVDNVLVGPQTIVKGAIVTDWEAVTLTGTWTTNTSYDSYSRRVGDSLEIVSTISTSGAPTAATLQVNMPSGLTIDLSKLPTVDREIGTAWVHDSTAANRTKATIETASSSVIQFVYIGGSVVTNTLPFAFGAGDSVSFTLKVPILGWSSNMVLSEDAGNREVVAKLDRDNVAQSVSATGDTKVLFTNTEFDTASGFNLTNNSYIIPESGYYDLSAQMYVTAQTSTDNNNLSIRTVSLGVIVQSYGSAGSSGALTYVCSGTKYLEKGEEVQLYFTSSTDNSYQISGAPYRTYLSIAKRSSPQTIAASEVVHLNAATNNSAVAVGTSDAILIYEQTREDTHNAYSSGGVYTIPQTGFYNIQASAGVGGITLTTAGAFYIQIVRNNATNIYQNFIQGNGAASVNYQAHINNTLYLSKGETIDIRVRASSTGGNILGAVRYNTLTITKVG